MGSPVEVRGLSPPRATCRPRGGGGGRDCSPRWASETGVNRLGQASVRCHELGAHSDRGGDLLLIFIDAISSLLSSSSWFIFDRQSSKCSMSSAPSAQAIRSARKTKFPTCRVDGLHSKPELAHVGHGRSQELLPDISSEAPRTRPSSTTCL